MDELLANLDDVVNTEEAIYDQAYISQSVSLYSQSSAPQDSQMSESRILPLFEMDNHEDVSVFLPELINGDFTTQQTVITQVNPTVEFRFSESESSARQSSFRSSMTDVLNLPSLSIRSESTDPLNQAMFAGTSRNVSEASSVYDEIPKVNITDHAEELAESEDFMLLSEQDISLSFNGEIYDKDPAKNHEENKYSIKLFNPNSPKENKIIEIPILKNLEQYQDIDIFNRAKQEVKIPINSSLNVESSIDDTQVRQQEQFIPYQSRIRQQRLQMENFHARDENYVNNLRESRQMFPDPPSARQVSNIRAKRIANEQNHVAAEQQNFEQIQKQRHKKKSSCFCFKSRSAKRSPYDIN